MMFVKEHFKNNAKRSKQQVEIFRFVNGTLELRARALNGAEMTLFCTLNTSCPHATRVFLAAYDMFVGDVSVIFYASPSRTAP